jgi:hypothetical protein
VEKDNLIHFPVERVMGTRVAEAKLGNMRQYGYPDFLKLGVEPFDWLSDFLAGKNPRSVLYGFHSIKEGVVKCFRSGHVRHLISRVPLIDIDLGERPKVEILCSLNQYFVFNWVAEQKLKNNPVVLLTPEQTDYFRLCERCSLMIEKGKKSMILDVYKRIKK